MRERRVLTGAGSYIAFPELGWDAEFTGYTVPNVSVAAIETTHTRSPDFFKEFAPGLMKDPGQVTVNYKVDPENPPPVGIKTDIRLVFKAEGTDDVTISFRGFVMEGGGFDVPDIEGEDDVTGSLTIQRSGKPSVLPAEPTEALS